jgi:hypothetical protein
MPQLAPRSYWIVPLKLLRSSVARFGRARNITPPLWEDILSRRKMCFELLNMNSEMTFKLQIPNAFSCGGLNKCTKQRSDV